MKHLKTTVFYATLLISSIVFARAFPFNEEENRIKVPIVFVTYAAFEAQVEDCFIFCESIRKFAGDLKDVPIRIYFPEYLKNLKEKYRDKFTGLSVELRDIKIPREAIKYALGAKPFVAALAEKEAQNEAGILAFFDPKIIFVSEPKEFYLTDDKDMAYRPVFHQNIGSLYSEKPDAFWSLLYKKLNISEDSIFPMEATADKSILRPYFNCGLLILRPEKGILRKWAEDFKALYEDEKIAEMSKEGKHNIFLHQAALVGAVLNNIKKEKMQLLPATYNYPLFFEKFYGSELQFDSIENAVTLKLEFQYSQLPKDWDKKLKGSKEVISWLKGKWFKKSG